MNLQSIFLISLWFFITPVYADEAVKSVEKTLSPEAAEKQKQQSAIDSLLLTQTALKEKQAEQRQLQRQLKSADATQQAELQAALSEVNEEVKNLKASFEQLAIGGISLEPLDKPEKEFNWEQELVLITQPLLESLKGLTEKPRKLEHLRSMIADRELRAENIEKAIASIESRLEAKPPKSLLPALKAALKEWQTNQKDNLREIELAEFQLASLLGNNEPWYITVSNTLGDFFSGRGTTLLVALILSVLVWLLMRGLLWVLLYRKRGFKETQQTEKRAGYRLAMYLYRFLTTLVITVVVMIVLYIRGDLLLLALMIIVFIGLALALRELLPRYLQETRALLNLGTIREGERVIYQGIPWQVAHINVHSIFKNPELYGVLRVPLSEVVTLNSRPLTRDENWFPCTKGDFLLMPDGALAEVLIQTPETVELKAKGGMRLSYPSASVFEMGCYNLSRGGSYGVASVFGIDYAHLDVPSSFVAGCFEAAIEAGIRTAGLGEHIEDVMVDFRQANSSSLDYLIYVTMHSRAASSYFKIERLIQQSCVKACKEQQWSIPFPQMTLHHINDESMGKNLTAMN